jgi:uncharacterized phiE125 gp8 family phage protein
MRAHKITVDPTLEPVSISEAKSHLRITWDSEDASIDAIINSARWFVETFTRRALINRTIETRFDAFANSMFLPQPPLVSVSSVQYIDGNGDAQTLSTDVYDVDTYSEPGRIWLKYGQSYPTPRAESHAVRVTHVSGYGSARSSIPGQLRQAMLMMIGHFYENREAVGALIGGNIVEMPIGASALLLPYVVSGEMV